MQAYYRPDRTARAFWLGRLKEGEYPVEVLKVGGKKMAKAVVKTQKAVVMVVPKYSVVYRKA
jgi:hypothetical protein